MLTDLSSQSSTILCDSYRQFTCLICKLLSMTIRNWLLPSQWISSSNFVQVGNNFWISWKLKRKLSSERDHYCNWHQFQRLKSNLWILWWKLLVLMHFWWHYVLADIFSHHITFWCLKHKFNIVLFFLGLQSCIWFRRKKCNLH